MSIEILCGGTPVPYKVLTFSGGELQVRVDFIIARPPCEIYARLLSASDVMELLLVTDALRRKYPDLKEIGLICPYLPYARQDRVCAEGEALSLKVFCNLINSQNYSWVKVWDVHSDVALALLDRVTNISASTFVRQIGRGSVYSPNLVIVAPDAGARKRAFDCFEAVGASAFVQAEKTRDPKTGKITGTAVYSGHIGDRDFLMVDDICDGGRTFIELAKKLRPLTDGKVNLYVTHGIMSQGMSVLKEHIDEVFIANPWPGLSGFTSIQ